MTAPDDLVAEFLVARADRDSAQARLDEVQARLVKQMEADQRKSYRWTADGKSHAVTYVAKGATVIDEKGLRKALTAKVFDKYTKKVLDKRAMETAMDEGVIDPITVSRFVSIKPSRPYLELREREVPE